MKTIVAIDPGASGGIALRWHDGQTTAHSMYPTEGEVVVGMQFIVKQALMHQESVVAYIEEVGGFIGAPMPGSRMFTFGRGFGFILGVLQTLQVPIHLVRPQKWQKFLSLGNVKDSGTKTDWKNKLKSEASRRFPHLQPTLKTADALLILSYAMEQP